MGEQDDRAAYLVEQRNTGRDRDFGLIVHELHLALGEVVEDGVSHSALLRRIAWPLSVFFHAREIATREHGSGPDLGKIEGRADGQFAVDSRNVGRAPARWVVDHVDAVALL